MPADRKLSADGVGILQSGEERGVKGFIIVEGVPLVLDRPRGEEETLPWFATCLMARSVVLAPADINFVKVTLNHHKSY